MEKKNCGAATQRCDQFQDVFASYGVKGARRFVQQQQLRSVDEGLGDAQALPHSARVFPYVRAHLSESRHVQQQVHPIVQLPTVHSMQPSCKPHGFTGGHPVVERGNVREEADPGPDCVVG